MECKSILTKVVFGMCLFLSLFSVCTWSCRIALAATRDYPLLPRLILADSRLELVQNPPKEFEKAVAAQLHTLVSAWQQHSTQCLNSEQADHGLIKTKRYLQGLVSRLADASGIVGRLQSFNGVCIEPIAEDNSELTLMFDWLNAEPRFSGGIISMGTRFISQAATEDELALMTAHELSHFLLKHDLYLAYLVGTGQTNNGDIPSGVLSRLEREADEFALRLALNAGFNTDNGVAWLKKLRGHDAIYFTGRQLDDVNDIVKRDFIYLGNTVDSKTTHPIPADVRNEIVDKLGPQS